MSRDFEQETRRALDAIHQWEKDINELGKGLSSIEFHDTIAADFERMEAVEAESARRKIAAERGSIQTAETLQQMSGQIQKLQDQIQHQQAEGTKEARSSKTRELVTIVLSALSLLATVVIGAITILFQLQQK